MYTYSSLDTDNYTYTCIVDVHVYIYIRTLLYVADDLSNIQCKKVSRQCVTYIYIYIHYVLKGLESTLYATSSDGYSNLVYFSLCPVTRRHLNQEPTSSPLLQNLI